VLPLLVLLLALLVVLVVAAVAAGRLTAIVELTLLDALVLGMRVGGNVLSSASVLDRLIVSNLLRLLTSTLTKRSMSATLNKRSMSEGHELRRSTTNRSNP